MITALNYDAVLLAGFGGPEGPDDVMPFLRNVTRGRGIPEERLLEVSHHYSALGGVSPINAQNRALQSALAAELSTRGIDLPVLWGNRNWTPYLTDEVAAAAVEGRTRLLGLATSAYSSYSSCRQYREDFGAALLMGRLVGAMRIDKVRPCFDQPGFIDPFADATVVAVGKALTAGIAIDQLHIVFTTHSVPTAMADSSGSAVSGDHGSGGAYVAQHLSVAGAVMSAVFRSYGSVGYELAFQSRSGPPSVPWLDPDVNDVIDRLAAGGTRGVVVVPIGFVSDHVEVIWDLDHEAAETAAGHGLHFARVATPGTDPRFVGALADLVAERLGGPVPRRAVMTAAARPNFCAPGCCRNLRSVTPTTAGQDSQDDWAGTGVDTALLIASGLSSPTPPSPTPPSALTPPSPTPPLFTEVPAAGGEVQPVAAPSVAAQVSGLAERG